MKYLLKSIKQDQGGVTLIEVLVVMGLLSSLLVIIATIFTSAVDVQQQSNTYSATDISGRFIMARLNYDIEHASAVLAPSTLGATTADLSLTLDGDTNVYSLSGNNLQLRNSTITANLNSDDVTVSNTSFQELGNVDGEPTILYSFTLTSVEQNHGASVSQTFASSAGLQ